jgi:MFS family permease
LVPGLALRDLMALSFDQTQGGRTTTVLPGARVVRRSKPAPGGRSGTDQGRLPAAWAWRVSGILFLIGIEAVLYGFSYPFFSLALEKYGLSNWVIGLNASLAGAGILIVGPFLPRLIGLLGLRDLVAGLFLISLLSFGAILATDSVLVWFGARFVMGACFAALWSTTEIWLNGVVDDRHRGRIIGASATLYAGAQFLGPLALSATGVTGALPLIAAMLPLAVGVVVALSIRSPGSQTARTSAEAPERLGLAFTLAGSLIALSFLAGVLETSMQSLLPLYGLAHGLTDAGASQMVALFSLGEAVLVALLGFMADRYGRERTLQLCVIPAIAVMIALPVSNFQIWVLGPTLFVAGGVISGIYTLGVIQIGQDFRGQRLAVVSTGFAMAYAAGAVVGSTPIGLAIDLFGAGALPVLISAGFFAFALLILTRSRTSTNAATSETMTAPANRVRPPGARRSVTVTQDVAPVRPAPVAQPDDLERPKPWRRPEYALEEWFRERAADLAQRRAQRQMAGPDRLSGLERHRAA